MAETSSPLLPSMEHGAPGNSGTEAYDERDAPRARVTDRPKI